MNLKEPGENCFMTLEKTLRSGMLAQRVWGLRGKGGMTVYFHLIFVSFFKSPVISRASFRDVQGIGEGPTLISFSSVLIHLMPPANSDSLGT